MIGVDRSGVLPRRVKGPGSESTFRVVEGSVIPFVGDVLLFEKTGRRFRVLEVRMPGGRRIHPALRVVMLSPDAYDGGTVHYWQWAKRPARRRLANRPRLIGVNE